MLFRRLATGAAALVLVLASCGREPTAPQTRDAAPRFARGFSFTTVFQQVAFNRAIVDLVDFNRVRIVLHRTDGSVALDSTVAFPSGVESLQLSFDIRLAPGAPATGEPLTLDLTYLNATGVAVFTGGPVPVVAVPSVTGAPPPPPVTVQVIYTGPGAAARTVRISPKTLAVTTGAPFTFSAAAFDAAGAAVPSAPIFYSVLDPARATLTSPTAGAGTALAGLGTTRIVAKLVSGAADTATLNIVPGVAARLVVQGGGGQTSAAGSLLAPVTALVTDVNGNATPGVAVNFTVASGGGSVTPASAVTDVTGRVVARWTLGSVLGAQTLELSSAGVPSVTVTATAFSALQTWVITQQPGASLVAGSRIAPAVVAELRDAVNAIVTSFNGSVTAAIGANSGGSTLGGTTTVTAVNGVATFANLTLDKVGTVYTITVNSAGAAAATTTPFSVEAGVASMLSIVSGNAQSGATNFALGQPVVVAVTDAFGNGKGGVPVTFTVKEGGGSVSLLPGTLDQVGRVGASWTLGPKAGVNSLTASAPALGNASVTFTATGISTCVTVPLTISQATPTQSGIWNQSDCLSGGRLYDAYSAASPTQTNVRLTLSGNASAKSSGVFQNGVEVVDWLGTGTGTGDLITNWYLAPGTYEYRAGIPVAAAGTTYTVTGSDGDDISCGSNGTTGNVTLVNQQLNSSDCQFNGRAEDRLVLYQPAGKEITITMTAGPVPALVFIRDVSTPAGSLLATNRSAPGGTATATYRTTVAGYYSVIFTSDPQPVTVFYSGSVTVK